MIPIQNTDQLHENLVKFEAGINSANSNTSEAYKGFVRRGICFVPYSSGNSIHFAPSRFIGYVDNDLKQHESESKHGQVTNAAISRVVGHEPASIPDLELTFRNYCRNLGFEAPPRGQFGKDRRYWLPEAFVALIETEIVGNLASDTSLNPTDREQVVLARLGQGKFRKNLINYWNMCPITKIDFVPILKASHIKPWANSSNMERVDPYNGILLSPNMDSLFDGGFISFNDDGSVIVSPQLGVDRMEALGGDAKVKLRFDAKHLPYLSFHRRERLRP